MDITCTYIYNTLVRLKCMLLSCECAKTPVTQKGSG